MSNLDYILIIIYWISAAIVAVGFFYHYYVNEKEFTVFDLLFFIASVFGPIINTVVAVVVIGIFVEQSDNIVIYRKKK